MQTRREPFSTPLNNLHKTSLKKEENWSTMRHIFATKFCDGGAVDGNLRLLCLWISWGWELAWIGCSVRSSRRWRCDVTLVNTNTLNHSLTMEHGLYDWKKKQISNAIYWTFANFKDFLSNILFSALVCCSPLLGAPRLPCGGVCTCKGRGRNEKRTVSSKGFLFPFVFVFVFVLGRSKNYIICSAVWRLWLKI